MTSNISEVLLKTVPFNGWCIQMRRDHIQKKIYDLLISEISKLPTGKMKFEDRSIYMLPIISRLIGEPFTCSPE